MNAATVPLNRRFTVIQEFWVRMLQRFGEITAMMLETELFRVEPDITILSCSGRFTIGTRLSATEALINTLIEQGARKLVLDLSEVEFVDSAGLGIIMHTFGELEQLGGALRIAAPSGQAAKLMEITHTNQILTTDPDLETSVKHLQGAGGAAAAS